MNGTLESRLTEREWEICLLIAEGLSNKHIGRRLGISHRTVEHHRASAMLKTGSKNIVQLLRNIEAEARA